MPDETLSDEQLAAELQAFAPQLRPDIDALVDQHWPTSGDPWRQAESMASRQAFKRSLTIILQET